MRRCVNSTYLCMFYMCVHVLILYICMSIGVLILHNLFACVLHVCRCAASTCVYLFYMCVGVLILHICMCSACV